ncbi:hypothetical protein [Micromonospora sp. NPDC005305]|uniref:hypothetical protein n=1 Tax=Micromonospora sp. NPDC005305 TaxID=3156875 RepID=UPI0033BB0C9B
MTASLVDPQPIRAKTGARPGPVVSRPIHLAASVASLTLVPSGLWRIALAFGAPAGFAAGTPLHADNFPGALSFYLIGLSVVAELLGLLTLGLVQHWGEVLPSWVPLLGGRRIPVLAAVVPAALGAAAVTLISVWGAWTWNGPDNMGHPDAPDGIAYWVMTVCYAPLLLWGPLLAVVTAAYYRRRRHQSR